ncbi:unnamed protein product [Debaryomyces tyrocola]|nr:unnamed protein product [Debaryomyces tyrocola]
MDGERTLRCSPTDDQAKHGSQSDSPSMPIIPLINALIEDPGIQQQNFQGCDSENLRLNLAITLPQKQFKRMKVAKACDRCRSQKTKCTGIMPCRSCIKHGILCHYSTQRNGGRDNEKVREKRSIRKDNLEGKNWANLNNIKAASHHHILNSTVESKKDAYIVELETKIKKLQSLNNLKVGNYSPLLNQAENEDNFSALTFESSRNNWKYLCRHQNILTFKLFKSIYESLLNESKLHVSMPRIQGFGWNMSGGRYLTPEKLPKIPDFELPSSDFYIDYYFRGINSVFAILHESVFREQIKSYNSLVLEERRTLATYTNDESLHETRLFQAQLYLVYALSIRFSEFENLTSNSVDMLALEEKLFKYAHKVMQILSFEWESFELIQGWLLITLYLRITHRLSSSFMALGNAITMTRAMGLGNRDPVVRNATSYEHLKAKRIFWCVYTFDRIFGLQYGRYCGFLEADIYRPYPVMCFETESDGWLTLPAFAMIHLARVSNYFNDYAKDNLVGIDIENLDRSLDELETWFSENGFIDDDVLKDVSLSGDLADLAKIQVKLHYYDLIFCFHGRSLFSFIGEAVDLKNMKLQTVLDISIKGLRIFQKLKETKLLYIPWYMTLILIFNVGIYSALFINSGVFVSQSKENLSISISLISHLKEASFIEAHSIRPEEKFTMAKECLWALKLLNHMIYLRFAEDAKELMDMGINHGSDDVNKQNFSQLGRINNKNNADKERYFTHNGRGETSSERIIFTESPKSPMLVSTPLLMNTFSTFDSLNQSENENLLENLRWFDQWLDFI